MAGLFFDPAADLIAKPAPQDTDPQGFLGYPDARCNAANPAVAIGRTSKSLIVTRGSNTFVDEPTLDYRSV